MVTFFGEMCWLLHVHVDLRSFDRSVNISWRWTSGVDEQSESNLGIKIGGTGCEGATEGLKTEKVCWRFYKIRLTGPEFSSHPLESAVFHWQAKGSEAQSRRTKCFVDWVLHACIIFLVYTGFPLNKTLFETSDLRHAWALQRPNKKGAQSRSVICCPQTRFRRYGSPLEWITYPAGIQPNADLSHSTTLQLRPCSLSARLHLFILNSLLLARSD